MFADFHGMFSSLVTQQQPDAYFVALLQSGDRSLRECERIFYDWGAAIAWRQRRDWLGLHGDWDRRAA